MCAAIPVGGGEKPWTEIRDYCIVRCALCLFTPQLSTVLTAPTHGGMARLS